MKIYNMESPKSGRAVPNQFIIEHEDKVYFQSYRSLIAVVKYGADASITLGCDWDYSVTTLKYLRLFFGEYYYDLGLFDGDYSSKHIREMIADGTIKYDENLR